MDVSSHPPHMFSQAHVDYFFRWRWWTAPLLFLPVVVGCCILSVVSFETPALLLSVLIPGGIFLWTLFEYCMHRFFFHFIGKQKSMEHMHYVVHGMHHAYPTDPTRVIFPPFGSAIIGSFIGLAMYLLLPTTYFMGIFSGFILGYVWYEFMHYAAHHIKWKSPTFMRLKRHHLLHHHSMAFRHSNFGVTTSLWDRVFRTYLI